MTDRKLEAKNQLVALARKKAESNGTTLELEVEKWLASYVYGSSDAHNRQAGIPTLSSKSSARVVVPRARKKPEKVAATTGPDSDTRSTAYRRLLGVISDTPKRNP